MGLVLVLAMAGCGGKQKAGNPSQATETQAASSPAKVKVLLDWTPGANHTALFYAREKGDFQSVGLNVDMRAPSDPSAPIKLVALNKVDLAISYEPDVFFAGEKGLPVEAVAAVVPVPLNTIMAKAGSGITKPADLKGKTVGSTGIPSDEAGLATILKFAGLRPSDITKVNVGYNLVPALLSGKADAVVGGYQTNEAIVLQQKTGKKPVVFPVNEVGVPTYDELVLVANKNRLRSDSEYASVVKRFVGAFVKAAQTAKDDQAGAIDVMKRVVDANPTFVARAVGVNLGLITPPHGMPIGCMNKKEWQTYERWLRQNNLLKSDVNPSRVMTTDYLPTSC